MISLRFAYLEWTEEGAVTRFPDNAEWGAQPHDLPHYHALAHRLGYDGDTLAYCREHELAHHVVAEGFGSHSWVLWALAHGEQPSPAVAAAEEALALALQRFVRAGERPFIDGADWDKLRARFLKLLEQSECLANSRQPLSGFSSGDTAAALQASTSPANMRNGTPIQRSGSG